MAGVVVVVCIVGCESSLLYAVSVVVFLAAVDLVVDTLFCVIALAGENIKSNLTHLQILLMYSISRASYHGSSMSAALYFLSHSTCMHAHISIKCDKQDIKFQSVIHKITSWLIGARNVLIFDNQIIDLCKILIDIFFHELSYTEPQKKCNIVLFSIEYLFVNTISQNVVSLMINEQTVSVLK